ncbi:hypothetical protein [uncultured Corynebacterium sp.]|uniref:hypothetical protein n=1 Tax=uncultured Corynebacterium sp. TaxID=159447 RepID=UPI00261976AD|nr:hypothetical protein [uncultured Corynebacterium sp.]
MAGLGVLAGAGVARCDRAGVRVRLHRVRYEAGWGSPSSGAPTPYPAVALY